MIYEHAINTPFGIFSFEWVRYDDNKKDWWIAGVFDNPGLASRVYNCNPHSGKYNFHGTDALESLMDHLSDLRKNYSISKPDKSARDEQDARTLEAIKKHPGGEVKRRRAGVVESIRDCKS